MSWLSGAFKYRKEITIAGATGAGTDYQVILKIGESSGSVGCDFDLENKSELFPDSPDNSGDLRFTQSDGVTPINFYVEEVTGSAPNRIAKIWIKVPDDLSLDQIVYCYFGNSASSNISDGSNTFLFYDDFETWEGWSTESTGIVSQSAERFFCNSYSAKKDTYGDPGGAYKLLPTVLARNICLEFRVNKYSVYTGYEADRVGLVNASGNGYGWNLGNSSPGGTLYIDTRNNWVATAYSPIATTTNNVDIWAKAVFKIDSSLITSERYLPDGSQDGVSSYTDTTYTSFDRVYILGGYTYWVDQLFIRKYIATEPSFLSAGSLEDSTILPSWLSGFSSRKQIAIQGTSEAGTDYQIQFKVGESLGSVGYDFHLGGNCSSFPNDIRFTDNDETTLLPYWIEKVTGSSPNRLATIWVKIADNLDVDTNIYCYYGNSSATYIGDGDNTFIDFEDFEGTVYDWSLLNGAFISNTVNHDFGGGNCVEFPGTNSTDVEAIERTVTFPSTGIVVYRTYVYATGPFQGHIITYYSGTTWYGPHVGIGWVGYSYSSDPYVGYLTYYTTAWVKTAFQIPLNQWVSIETVINLDTSSYDLYANDTLYAQNCSFIGGNSPAGLTVTFKTDSYTTSGTIPITYIDSPLQRKGILPQPQFLSSGLEITQSSFSNILANDCQKLSLVSHRFARRSTIIGV